MVIIKNHVTEFDTNQSTVELNMNRTTVIALITENLCHLSAN